MPIPMITWPADIRIWNSRVGEAIVVGPTKQAMLARIKTQHLLLVASLAEYRSVQRAAQALNMTQPAASKLLHQLETILGVPLFIRHPRGVVPTEFGEILVRHARVALAELRHAHDSLEALRTGLAGHIKIGTEATSATGLVPLHRGFDCLGVSGIERGQVGAVYLDGDAPSCAGAA
jgi:molybdenum-dependent DNA-binding transcriptional regulator ModE